jgi:DNA-binding MarR family transcriptional regulator
MIAAGFAMLSRIDENTPGWVLSLDMLVLGLGLGLVMQVLVIAVQNAVNYRDLGAATSGVTFFRSIGSVVGVALFGAVYSAELASNLAGLMATGALPPDFSQGTIEAAPAALAQLPPAIHAGIVHAYAAALRPIFLVALPFALVAFGLTWMLEEAPLRKTTHATDPGDVFGIPKSSASIDELARALAVLLSRESRQQMYLRLAERAGLDLAPGASWLLFRIHDRPTRTPDELARQYSIPVDRVTGYLADLTRQGLVVDGRGGPEGGTNNQMALSPSGQDRVTRLIEARRAGLAELLADWRPEQHDEITHLVNKLADPGRPDPEDGAARAA